MAGAPLLWPDFLRGTLPQAVSGLASSQSFAQCDLRAGQQRQLEALLGFVRLHTPWYGEHRWREAALPPAGADAATFEAAWTALPILTKAELREQAAALRSRHLPAVEAPVETVRTSGSVGIPVEVRTTRTTRLAWNALTVREHQWRRRDFARRLGVIRYQRPADRQAGGTDLPSWGPPVAELYPTGPASVIHIGEDVATLADWLCRFDPHYLLAYPSVAAALLDTLAERPPALAEVRLMSEPLDPELEVRLVAQWGVTVTDLYSANEVGHIAFRCERGSLHVQAEAVRVEVLRDDGTACAAGETGRVVITSLHNLATPLVRYEIGDYATVGGPCPCGRQHPVLERVRGRVRNLLRLPDGRQVWPTALGLIRRVTAVRQAQYVQVAPGIVELRIVTGRELTAAETAEATALAACALGNALPVRVVRVAEIPRGPTGKFEEFLSLLVN